MKVIHYTWSLGIGGIERLVLDLCNEQRKNGIQASLLVGQAVGGFTDNFRDAGISVFDGQLKSGFDPGWGSGKAILAEFKSADIIHMHCFSPTIAKLAKRSGTPIVYTDHGSYGFGRKNTWRDQLKKMMQARFFARDIRFMTFNSKFTNDKTKEIFSLEGVANQVVYNGVDFNATPDDGDENQQSGLTRDLENVFVIGTSSRFAGVKRIDKLIHAYAAMKDLDNTCLLLVGDGGLRPAYEELVEKLGIQKTTVFTGYKTNVKTYQSLMDVCVFPSLGETFGLAVIETLGLGKPTIVTTDSGGMAEVLMPLEPSDVVDDVAQITQRLEKYCDDWRSGKIDNCGKQNARIKYAHQFNVKRMSEEFSAVYSQCL